ncbi:MAG: hypothetical protein ACM3Q4_05720 [Acidobacteriota bacterium]
MGTGQTMMTILAMILMGRLIVMVNENNANMGEAVKMSEYRIMATSLATSYLEDAAGKEYDEKTLPPSDPPTITSATCTGRGSLGPEPGEVYPNFDDFDDFNKLDRLDTLRDIAGTKINVVFRVRGTVEYVKVEGGAVISEPGMPTYTKQLTITVTSESMLTDNFSHAMKKEAAAAANVQDTLVFRTLYSYWRLR